MYNVGPAQLTFHNDFSNNYVDIVCIVGGFLWTILTLKIVKLLSGYSVYRTVTSLNFTTMVREEEKQDEQEAKADAERQAVEHGQTIQDIDRETQEHNQEEADK